jgi:monoterpene epsilon-lactone hydrolase
MTMASAALETDGALHIPAQDIPVPTSISREGQAFLAAAAKRIAALVASGGAAEQSRPSLADQAAAAASMLRPMASRFAGTFETIALPQGASLYRATPEGRIGRKAHVAFLDIHGGGFVAGGGEMCQLLARLRAADYGAVVYAVDYRLAPEHRFPAALDDCMAAYREVLKHCPAADLVVGGSSAGGNLAAAMLLRSRDEGLPLPAGLMLMTPATDFTRAGDTHQTNRLLDVTLYGGEIEGPDAYAGGHDRTDPYLSPLFGDFAKGWPPTLLTTGTRDLLLSDTVRMHRALRNAGVSAELHVAEASPHGGFMGQAPEDREILAECRRFINEAWRVEA